jgi:hypothetical protein
VHPRRDLLSASKVPKLLTKLMMLGKDRLVASVASQKHGRCERLPSAMIAVRDKSVGKHDRRDAQRTQDQLRKNTNAVSGHIKKRDLFLGAGFQTKILALVVTRLGPIAYQSISGQKVAHLGPTSNVSSHAICGEAQ